MMKYKGFIISKTAQGYHLELPRDFTNLSFGIFPKLKKTKAVADQWLQAWRLAKYEYHSQPVTPYF